MAGLLAGLDAELIAVLFLIVVLASAVVLRSITSSSAHSVPVIGGQIGEAVDRFWAGLFGVLAGPTNASVGVFTSTLDWVTAQWTQLTATVSGLAQLTYTAGHKIVTLTIPYATGLVVSQATTLATAARAYALLQVQRAEVAAGVALAGAEARSLALYHEAQTAALALFRTAEHDAALAVAVAERDAAGLIRAEHDFAAAAAATAEGYAAHLLTQAITEMHAIEAGILGQLGGVTQADERAIQETLAKLRTEIADASKAASAAAAGTLTGVLADVAILKALRCLKFCDALADIGEFSSLLDVGLIFLLVEEARANPRGLQGFMAGTVAPLLRAEIPSL